MSDKIKEILDKLNKLEYDDIHLIICEVISRREIKILLDYIANLQEQLEIKNEGFKATVEELCETSEKLEQLQQEINKLTAESTEWESKFYDMEDNFHNANEEIERLKEENKRIFSKVNDDELLISNAMNYAEAQDYKSRCEKAIEYVEHHKFNKFGDIDCGEAEEIINILNGGDEE